MTMTVEKSLQDFEFWGGAAENVAKLTPDELAYAEECLEDLADSSNDVWSMEEVNDFFWFDFVTVCEWLNIDVEEMMARE